MIFGIFSKLHCKNNSYVDFSHTAKFIFNIDSVLFWNEWKFKMYVGRWVWVDDFKIF